MCLFSISFVVECIFCNGVEVFRVTGFTVVSFDKCSRSVVEDLFVDIFLNKGLVCVVTYCLYKKKLIGVSFFSGVD